MSPCHCQVKEGRGLHQASPDNLGGKGILLLLLAGVEIKASHLTSADTTLPEGGGLLLLLPKWLL